MSTLWWWSPTSKKRAQYDEWIARALQEREDKVHTVLLETPSCSPSDSDAALTVVETRRLIEQGKMDARQNVVQLAHRCRRYGRPMRVICEELYDSAAQQAATQQGTQRASSPLYGVPISIKESMRLTGTYSTGGLACRLRERDQHDGLMVHVLKHHGGAIPLCTGNVTQLMMLPESVNRIWGRAVNPWDGTRTPGGSSGGDAALVAMNCVPAALTSDVAGSIRIPASFCGVTGFKPTSARVSGQGNMRPRKDNKQGPHLIIPTTLGVIARTVDCCAAFLQTVWCPALWDGDLNLPRLPFDQEAFSGSSSSGKLRLAYFETDGWFEPCATSKRAVRETIEGLRAAGHTCESFELPTDGWHNYGLLVAINGAEGNAKSYVEALECEQIIDEYSFLILAANLPSWLRTILVRVLDERRAHSLKQTRSGGISVFELWKKAAEVIKLRELWSNAMKGYDAIIFPAMPIPALPHGMSAQLTSTCSYMFIANMLDWPCGAVPVTTVRPDEAKYPLTDLPANQRDMMARLVDDYVMPGSAGMPISVNVMTSSFCDEKCLRVMKEVERVVSFSAKPQAYKTMERNGTFPGDTDDNKVRTGAHEAPYYSYVAVFMIAAAVSLQLLGRYIFD